MKIGQIYLEKAVGDSALQFQSIVEGLDRLAVEQHVLVASASLARSLGALPYVTVGPVVRTAVMAYCLIPEVDVVHVYGIKSGQAGLLLTLTRAVPYVITATEQSEKKRGSLWASIRGRACESIAAEELHPDKLVDAYQRVLQAKSEGPKNADGGQ